MIVAAFPLSGVQPRIMEGINTRILVALYFTVSTSVTVCLVTSERMDQKLIQTQRVPKLGPNALTEQINPKQLTCKSYERPVVLG